MYLYDRSIKYVSKQDTRKHQLHLILTRPAVNIAVIKMDI